MEERRSASPAGIHESGDLILVSVDESVFVKFDKIRSFLALLGQMGVMLAAVR
jgi:hypothetical protein